jgi:hypothetical protein
MTIDAPDKAAWQFPSKNRIAKISAWLDGRKERKVTDTEQSKSVTIMS